MKLKKSYSSKQAAKKALWRHAPADALVGDGGLTAQWINNGGRTQWATVDHDDNYCVADRKWFVRLSTDEG